MNQIHAVHDDDEEKEKAEDDRGWGWWMVCQSWRWDYWATMTSVFDEDES